QNGKDGGELEHMGVEMNVAEGRGAGHQLLIYARFVVKGQRVRHLDDDHAVEQSLVLLLLQKLVEFGQIGVRQNRLVQVNERKARHFHVLFLGEREQKVEKFAFDLEDLDHLEHAAAGRVDCA